MKKSNHVSGELLRSAENSFIINNVFTAHRRSGTKLFIFALVYSQAWCILQFLLRNFGIKPTSEFSLFCLIHQRVAFYVALAFCSILYCAEILSYDKFRLARSHRVLSAAAAAEMLKAMLCACVLVLLAVAANADSNKCYKFTMEDAEITVPAGFCASVYANNLACASAAANLCCNVLMQFSARADCAAERKSARSSPSNSALGS